MKTKEIENAASDRYLFPTSGYLNEQRDIENATALLKRGFKEGAEWMEQQLEPLITDLGMFKARAPKWITIKERLPEKEGTVLACTHYGKTVTAYFMDISNEWDVTGFDGAKELSFITAWMPLPEFNGEL